MITDGARRAAEERRNFRARLGETKDVVDEKEHVLILFVAEIFRHRESRKRHAQTRARRLVHLAKNQRHLRFAEVLLVDDARLAHFLVKVVALARALAHARKHGDAAMQFGDVVDQFHDHDRLADARATERANLAAF